MKNFTNNLSTINKQLVFMYFCAKMLHWNSKDYALHLLFDRISEDCIESIDTISESCILPFDNKIDIDFDITTKNCTLENLKDSINQTANIIQELVKEDELSEGAKNTLSGIAEKLNVKAYLLENNTNGNNK